MLKLILANNRKNDALVYVLPTKITAFSVDLLDSDNTIVYVDGLKDELYVKMTPDEFADYLIRAIRGYADDVDIHSSIDNNVTMSESEVDFNLGDVFL